MSVTVVMQCNHIHTHSQIEISNLVLKVTSAVSNPFQLFRDIKLLFVCALDVLDVYCGEGFRPLNGCLQTRVVCLYFCMFMCLLI